MRPPARDTLARIWPRLAQIKRRQQVGARLAGSLAGRVVAGPADNKGLRAGANEQKASKLCPAK